MKIQNQLDKKHASVTIGQTALQIKDYGCTICSICMGMSFFNVYTEPKDASKLWAFDTQGRILWTKTNFTPFRFVWRGYDKNFKAYAKENTFIILEVQIKGWNTRHWILWTKNELFDPYGGKRYNTLPPDFTITGFAVFEYVSQVSDWAKDSWEKYKGIFTNPQQELDIIDIEKDLLANNVLSKEEGKITAERWAVIKNRLSNSSVF